MRGQDRLVRKAFYAALELRDAERLSVIKDVCGSDLNAVKIVQRLLENAENGSGSQVVPESPRGSARTRLQPDSTIGGYVIKEYVDSGAMGEVYVARQARSNQTVALKVLRQALEDSEEARYRFKFEAEALGALQHPSIAQLIDVGEDSRTGRSYLVMEFVDGPNLSEFLCENELTTEEKLALLRNIALGVEHANRNGIIHRDLKPQNIKVTEGRPKILDFGVARLAERSSDPVERVTEPRQQVGTLAYMSPEQSRGSDVSIRSDVYSLGVICTEVFLGRHPYELQGKTRFEVLRALEETEPTLPSGPARYMPDLATLLRTAMAKDPGDRYSSCQHLANDLSALEEHRMLSVSPPSWRRGAKMWALRNPQVTALLGLILVVLAVSGVAILNSVKRANASAREADLVAGELAAQVGEWGVAEGIFRKVLATDPTHHRALFGLVEALVGRFEYQQALRELDRLSSLELSAADEASVEFLLGAISPRDPKFPRSQEAHLHRARELGLEPADDQVAQALLQRQLRPFLAYLDRALEIDPRHRVAHTARLASSLVFDDIEKLDRQTDRFEAVYPRDPFLQVARTVLWLRGHGRGRKPDLRGFDLGSDALARLEVGLNGLSGLSTAEPGGLSAGVVLGAIDEHGPLRGRPEELFEDLALPPIVLEYFGSVCFLAGEFVASDQSTDFGLQRLLAERVALYVKNEWGIPTTFESALQLYDQDPILNMFMGLKQADKGDNRMAEMYFFIASQKETVSTPRGHLLKRHVQALVAQVRGSSTQELASIRLRVQRRLLHFENLKLFDDATWADVSEMVVTLELLDVAREFVAYGIESGLSGSPFEKMEGFIRNRKIE